MLSSSADFMQVDTTYRCVARGACALLALFFIACANKSAPIGPGSIVRSENQNLVLDATVEEQARRDILETPTTFVVSFEDDSYSWERAKFFLENYVGGAAGHASVVTKMVGDRLSLASNPEAAAYQYEIAKDLADGGYSYVVTCRAGAGGQVDQAQLNAGNFARFVRDGRLELSLLSN